MPAPSSVQIANNGTASLTAFPPVSPSSSCRRQLEDARDPCGAENLLKLAAVSESMSSDTKPSTTKKLPTTPTRKLTHDYQSLVPAVVTKSTGHPNRSQEAVGATTTQSELAKKFTSHFMGVTPLDCSSGIQHKSSQSINTMTPLLHMDALLGGQQLLRNRCPSEESLEKYKRFQSESSQMNSRFPAFVSSGSLPVADEIVLARFGNIRGSLPEVVHQAKDIAMQWVGSDLERELCAQGFEEDLQRHVESQIAAHAQYCRETDIIRRDAEDQKASTFTYKRVTRRIIVRTVHARQTETTLVMLVRQLAQNMVERYHECKNLSPLEEPPTVSIPLAVQRPAPAKVVSSSMKEAVKPAPRSPSRASSDSEPPARAASPKSQPVTHQLMSTKAPSSPAKSKATESKSPRAEGRLDPRLPLTNPLGNVYSGKGEKIKQLNKHYRHKIHSWYPSYIEASNDRDKREIAVRIVEDIRSNGGRFLDANFKEMSKAVARTKVMKALKDAKKRAGKDVVARYRDMQAEQEAIKQARAAEARLEANLQKESSPHPKKRWMMEEDDKAAQRQRSQSTSVRLPPAVAAQFGTLPGLNSRAAASRKRSASCDDSDSEGSVDVGEGKRSTDEKRTSPVMEEPRFSALRTLMDAAGV